MYKQVRSCNILWGLTIIQYNLNHHFWRSAKDSGGVLWKTLCPRFAHASSTLPRSTGAEISRFASLCGGLPSPEAAGSNPLGVWAAQLLRFRDFLRPPLNQPVVGGTYGYFIVGKGLPWITISYHREFRSCECGGYRMMKSYFDVKSDQGEVIQSQFWTMDVEIPKMKCS